VFQLDGHAFGDPTNSTQAWGKKFRLAKITAIKFESVDIGFTKEYRLTDYIKSNSTHLILDFHLQTLIHTLAQQTLSLKKVTTNLYTQGVNMYIAKENDDIQGT